MDCERTHWTKGIERLADIELLVEFLPVACGDLEIVEYRRPEETSD
jgi:hypothetical protein